MVLLFLVGFGIRQTLLYFAAADNCITTEQWTTMSQDQTHCYVEYDRNNIPEVWEPPKDSSGWTHHGNSICGTNVTQLIPASHLADVNKYLNIGARYIGTMGSCVQPTATPTPTTVPTDTPIPTPTTIIDSPTPTDIPSPTSTLVPSATPTPDQQANASVAIPTATPTVEIPAAIKPTATPAIAKISSSTLVAASQFSADASVALALVVMGLAIYFKLKSPKPKSKSSEPISPPPANDIYKVTVSYKSPDGKFDWVNLDNGQKIIEGLYGGPQPCPEGPCHVSGVMKIYPPNKPYLEIASIVKI